ncbi:MAG: HDOD domain-containing protein [Deltaproteobacteria bacterium]|jgi:signal transduction histidine kinase|nr:HDOD domain-containing protein [Deltaproteobacteria bacterium]
MEAPPHEFLGSMDISMHLPTLPHILLKLIDVCNTEPDSIKEISQIINKDAALSARVLSIVNSVCSCPPNKVTNIDQALLLVGTNSIKNIAISASVHHAFDQAKDKSIVPMLKQFWSHSLMCAALAKLIAEKTSYPTPDEAFLSGLLHDVGKLVLWANLSKEQHAKGLEPSIEYSDMLLASETESGTSHYEVGALMINQWKLQSFMADAVRYHHEPVDRIMDALPLVRIVFVANALCTESIQETDAGLKAAEEVFGFARSEVEGLLSLATEEVKQAAESLDIELELQGAMDGSVIEKDAEKQKELVRAVRQISLLQGTLQNVLQAHGEESTLKLAIQGLQVLFDVHDVLFFMYDEERDALVGKDDTESDQHVRVQEFVIPVRRRKSLLAKSLVQGTPLDSFGHLSEVDLSIIDDQLIRLLGKDGMLCLPMLAHRKFVGVIVLGMDEMKLSNLSEEANLLALFAQQLALYLHAENARQTRDRSIQSERLTASSALARKVAHEVSNPLGIIKNYLKILGLKLAQDSPGQEEIGIINEEIDRVSTIISELSNFSEPGVQHKEMVDINTLISDLIKITHESLMLNSGIKAHLDLGPSLQSVVTDKNGLKQVLINLINNAVEAMPEGGNLYINTRSFSDGLGDKLEKDAKAEQQYVETTIRDDGSGIPDMIKLKLFEPFVTTKGEGHAGLGLSIAHSIIQELNGTMTCESDETKGTTFKIVMPTGKKERP